MFVVLVKFTLAGDPDKVMVHAVGPFHNVERANEYVEGYVDAPTEKVVSLEIVDLYRAD